MTKEKHMNDQAQIEQFREQLGQQRVDDFVESLQSEDLNATRTNLIATISGSLEALLETERMFVANVMIDGKDGICPSCLIQSTIDATRVESIVQSFNDYLSTSDEGGSCD